MPYWNELSSLFLCQTGFILDIFKFGYLSYNSKVRSSVISLYFLQEFAYRTKTRDLQNYLAEFDKLIAEEKELEEKIQEFDGKSLLLFTIGPS